MSRKQKLELMWIGKNKQPRLEPRILVEQPDLSYHFQTRSKNEQFDNSLVNGDNLLTLKALEQNYRATVKLAYLDPPV